MWYVIQTMTGHEEELVKMVRRQLPQDVYTECFVAYYERIWRKQQQSLVHVERLFPGYVFILTEKPEEVFLCLKTVPAMSKIISDGHFTFLPLEQEEEEFLSKMLSGDRIIRLSYVEKDGRGRILRVFGPLREYLNQVARYQYKKRYVLIRFRLLGRERMAALGIILPEDVRGEIAYGKVEMPAAVPKSYQMEYVQAERKAAEEPFSAGDCVAVISGELSGMTGVVWKVRKNTLDVGIRLFDQDMPMEVPKEIVRVLRSSE